MTILYVNLVIVYVTSLMARYFAQSNLDHPFPVKIQPSKFFTFCALSSLVLVSGLRRNIGDTYYYRHSFQINTYTLESIINERDFGFGVLQLILQRFTHDPQVLIFTTAIITNVLIVFVLYRYARIFELGLYVYITGGLFLISMNGIRQFLAAAIIFAATKYILNGDWKKFVGVVFIAALFHQSALIFIPVYFLIRRDAWTKTTAVLLVMAVILVLGYNEFSRLLFAAIGDSQYGHYQEFNEGGASIIRVMVTAAPLALAYIGREKLRDIFPKSDYIVNLSLLNLVFMVIATQNWIFARFTIYFGLYQLILVAWVVKLFHEKDQKLIYFLIIIFYFIYFYYEHVLSLNIQYRSDYLTS